MKMESIEPPSKKRRGNPLIEPHLPQNEPIQPKRMKESSQIPTSLSQRKKFKRRRSSLTCAGDARRLLQAPPSIPGDSQADDTAQQAHFGKFLRHRRPAHVTKVEDGPRESLMHIEATQEIDELSLHNVKQEEHLSTHSIWIDDYAFVRNLKQEIQYLPSVQPSWSIREHGRTSSDPTHFSRAVTQHLSAYSSRAERLYQRRCQLILEPFIEKLKNVINLSTSLEQSPFLQVGSECSDHRWTEHSILQQYNSIPESLRTGTAELFIDPTTNQNCEAVVRLVAQDAADNKILRPPFRTFSRIRREYHGEMVHLAEQQRMQWLRKMRSPGLQVPIGQDQFVRRLLEWPEMLQFEGQGFGYSGLCASKHKACLHDPPQTRKVIGKDFGITWSPRQGRATQAWLCRAAFTYQCLLLDLHWQALSGDAGKGILDVKEHKALSKNVEVVWTLLANGNSWERIMSMTPFAGLEMGLDREDET